MKSPREANPIACSRCQRHPLVLVAAWRGSTLSLLGSAGFTTLRRNPWRQHGATVPQRRPGARASCRPLQGRRHRRVPQLAAARARNAPHRRDPRRSLHLQGRQQQLPGSGSPHRGLSSIGKLWLHMPRARLCWSGCTTPLSTAWCADSSDCSCSTASARRSGAVDGGAERDIRDPASQGPPLVNTSRDQRHPRASSISVRSLPRRLFAAVVFLVLAAFAFTRPAHRAVPRTTPTPSR